MKQYSHKRRSKVGTIIAIVLLVMLLGASISVLGLATKGFKTKPSWKNLQKPKIEKEKEKPKEKIEYDKNLDVQKELKKVNNKASMNMALFDLRKTGTDVLSINHDYIRTVRDYGEKESEAYKQLSKLTSGFAEDKIDKVQIDHSEVTFGYMLKKETYKDNSKWQEMIDDISKQTNEEVIEEIFAGKKVKLRIRGVKSEENDGVGLLVTVSSKDLKEVFGTNEFDDLSNIRFFYEGFNNKTYIGKLRNVWVQIRIPKKIASLNYANETKVVLTFKDYFYAKDGYLIKKWFPGQDLYKIKITEKVEYAIFNCLTNFRKLKLPISKFNWYAYKVNDEKYYQLLEKYKDQEYVISHNNIKRHNILINKYGFVKLIDFEYVAYNSKYVDLVGLYLFLGIDKQKIIEHFQLDETIFDDYIYLVETFDKAAYKEVYEKLDIPQCKITDSFSQMQNRDYSISNKFICQKYHNQFDNRLNLKLLEQFYFVPICVYEDNDKVIWRWLDCNSVYFLNRSQIKILAHAMKTYHDSDVKFPSFILKEKVDWYMKNINLDDVYNDIGGKEIVDQILLWINDIKPDANCHNNLNLDNIFFNENYNLYIIDWSVAYYNNRFLDIAFMFENIGLSEASEAFFWLHYGIKKPDNFYKYRIISHFVAYLYNNILNGDFTMSNINVRRIKDILEKKGE